jgi:hypothetical protein
LKIAIGKRIGELLLYGVFIFVDAEGFWPQSHLLALGIFLIGTLGLLLYDGKFAASQVAAVMMACIIGCGLTYWYMPENPGHTQTAQARRLSSAQRKEIVERLSQFKGTKIAAGAPFGDDEAQTYRDDFVNALSDAGWAFDGHVGEEEIDPPLIGVWVTMNREETEAGRIPDAVEALLATLINIHVIERTPQGKMPLRVDTNWHSDPIDRISIDVGKQPK